MLCSFFSFCFAIFCFQAFASSRCASELCLCFFYFILYFFLINFFFFAPELLTMATPVETGACSCRLIAHYTLCGWYVLFFYYNTFAFAFFICWFYRFAAFYR